MVKVRHVSNEKRKVVYSVVLMEGERKAVIVASHLYAPTLHVNRSAS